MIRERIVGYLVVEEKVLSIDRLLLLRLMMMMMLWMAVHLHIAAEEVCMLWR